MCSLVLALRQVGWNLQGGKEIAWWQGRDVETLADREFAGRQPCAPRASVSLNEGGNSLMFLERAQSTLWPVLSDVATTFEGGDSKME